MKYTIEIDVRFWPVLFPEWENWDKEQRRHAQLSYMDDINSQFFEGDGHMMVVPKFYDTLTDEARAYIKIAPLVSSEGVARIQAEREEQRAKHGFSDEHDDALDGGELETAAIAVLTEDPSWWPERMDRQLFMRATEKDTQGRLAVAGALIAAELDRIERQLARQGGPKLVGTTLPPVGTWVMLRPGIERLLTGYGMSQSEADHLSSLSNLKLWVCHAEVRGQEVWVQLGENGPMIPLACCTIIHDEQTTN